MNEWERLRRQAERYKAEYLKMEYHRRKGDFHATAKKNASSLLTTFSVNLSVTYTPLYPSLLYAKGITVKLLKSICPMNTSE